MNQMYEDVTKAVAKGRLHGYQDSTIANDAVYAAEPHLRAKHRAELFKELAAKIDDDPSCLFGVLHGGDCFDGAVVTWIAAQYRKENTNANED